MNQYEINATPYSVKKALEISLFNSSEISNSVFKCYRSYQDQITHLSPIAQELYFNSGRGIILYQDLNEVEIQYIDYIDNVQKWPVYVFVPRTRIVNWKIHLNARGITWSDKKQEKDTQVVFCNLNEIHESMNEIDFKPEQVYYSLNDFDSDNFKLQKTIKEFIAIASNRLFDFTISTKLDSKSVIRNCDTELKIQNALKNSRHPDIAQNRINVFTKYKKTFNVTRDLFEKRAEKLVGSEDSVFYNYKLNGVIFQQIYQKQNKIEVINYNKAFYQNQKDNLTLSNQTVEQFVEEYLRSGENYNSDKYVSQRINVVDTNKKTNFLTTGDPTETCNRFNHVENIENDIEQLAIIGPVTEEEFRKIKDYQKANDFNILFVLLGNEIEQAIVDALIQKYEY